MPAQNLNQILFVGRLSIANEKHSISNITWIAQGLKTGIFVGIVETNSPDWSWVVATQVTYTPLGLDFWVKPHIGYMSIILSLIK